MNKQSLTKKNAEGGWTDVMNLIGKAHAELHDQGVQRVHSDVRITTRFVPHTYPLLKREADSPKEPTRAERVVLKGSTRGLRPGKKVYLM